MLQIRQTSEVQDNLGQAVCREAEGLPGCNMTPQVRKTQVVDEDFTGQTRSYYMVDVQYSTMGYQARYGILQGDSDPVLWAY